jgi:UDP-glucose 4-epimerase
MRYLITGGCGFIGQCLISRLVRETGNTVRIVDNLTNGVVEAVEASLPVSRHSRDDAMAGLKDATPAAAQLVVGDIEDADLAMAACRGIDVVIHLAANTGVAPSVADPRADCLANVIGTFNYLEAMRLNGGKRFIFASSSATVGQGAVPIVETLPANPMSPYGASKLAGEGYCSAYFHCYGLRSASLRFGNVYGPGSQRKESVVAKFIRRAMAGEILEIYGDGSQTRDFIYIDDLAEAIERAVVAEDLGAEAFQIATNRETTLAEMAEVLRAALVAHGIPDPGLRCTQPRPGDVLRNYSDTSKARRLLGWQARTPLLEGLGATVDWFVRTQRRGA